MDKNVKIPERLFIQLVKFFLLDDNSQYAACRDGIQSKLDKLYQRYLYTLYNNQDLSDDERERARQAYLDAKGIPNNFRW